MPDPVSFKSEVQADNSGTWSANALRFATADEAAAYGDNLACRWTAVREWRAAESADPITHTFQGGKLSPLPREG